MLEFAWNSDSFEYRYLILTVEFLLILAQNISVYKYQTFWGYKLIRGSESVSSRIPNPLFLSTALGSLSFSPETD
jgi:F0F1-type ATP synthase assembly protein I